MLKNEANNLLIARAFSLSFSGVLGGISMLLLSLYKNLPLALVLLNLMAGSAGIAIADVTIDACVTQNSISHPSLAGDMQSLCGMSSSVGSLVGFAVSGFLIHLLGPRVRFFSSQHHIIALSQSATDNLVLLSNRPW